ncbi:MAG TPA: hypothetical protein VE972_13605 [Conexibacter sp.]|nr:hypothetical protein [Conexibacter sp.]
MHNRITLLTAALTAALALSFGAGAAAALRSLSLTGETMLTLNSKAFTFRSSFSEIICEVTMVKTLVRAIPKVEGTTIGAVTEVRFNIPSCRIRGTGVERVNSIQVLRVGVAENWRLFYKSILGTLPRITGAIVNIANSHILLDLTVFGGNVRCLYDGEIAVLARLDATGRIVSLESIGRERLEKERESNGLCSQRGNLLATGIEGQLREQSRTTITLM